MEIIPNIIIFAALALNLYFTFDVSYYKMSNKAPYMPAPLILTLFGLNFVALFAALAITLK